MVSSLETFVWLPIRVFGGGGRVGFVAPFCLAEISRAAICRVTAPIEVIFGTNESKVKQRERGITNWSVVRTERKAKQVQHSRDRATRL